MVGFHLLLLRLLLLLCGHELAAAGHRVNELLQQHGDARVDRQDVAHAIELDGALAGRIVEPEQPCPQHIIFPELPKQQRGRAAFPVRLGYLAERVEVEQREECGAERKVRVTLGRTHVPKEKEASKQEAEQQSQHIVHVMIHAIRIAPSEPELAVSVID